MWLELEIIILVLVVTSIRSVGTGFCATSFDQLLTWYGFNEHFYFFVCYLRTLFSQVFISIL